MSDVLRLFERSVAEFDARVQQVEPDDWAKPTPCSEWDVRALVNHLVNEDRWVAPLMAGKTIADVGDSLDGDLLGDDPKSSWKSASNEAIDAVREAGAMDRAVHVSYGDIPGERYIQELLIDHLIHAWDLARGIGADESLDPELVEHAYSLAKPVEQALKDSGAYGEKIEPLADADLQTKLLAIVGRRP